MSEQETYQIGDTVLSPIFGKGVILPAQEEEGYITVRFEGEAGVKHLCLQYAKLQKVEASTSIDTEALTHQDALKALIKDQMEALDECWRTIEAEYGIGPSILDTIEELRERAKELLEEQS